MIELAELVAAFLFVAWVGFILLAFTVRGK
jgi:hypothetical protein